MKKLQKLLLILLLINVSLSMEAKPFLTVTHFSGDEEALHGRLVHMLQDKKGFMWISTYDGLNKYDGYKFTKYKSRPNANSVLESNRIDRFFENNNGDLWCLTANKIYLFETKNEQFIDLQPVFEQKRKKLVLIENVFVLPNGVSWLVSRDGECYRVQDKDPLHTCEDMKYDLKSNADVMDIWLDSNGYEWIFTTNGTFRYGREDYMSKLRFRYAFNYEKGVWLTSDIGGQMACYSYKDDSYSFVEFPQHIDMIYAQERIDDSTLISISSNGIIRTNIYAYRSELISEVVLRAFYIDRNHIFWGMTEDYQVCQILDDGKPILVNRPSDYRFLNYRVKFEEDEYGTLWLLPYDSGDILYFDDDLQVFERPLNPIINNPYARGCYEDAQGNLWYRQEHGMDCVTRHNTPFEVHLSPTQKEVRSMMVDSSNRYWLALRSGTVSIYNQEGGYLGNLAANGTIVPDMQVKFGTSLYCMKEDSRHSIWLGSRTDGLFLLEPTTDSMNYKVSQFRSNPDDITSLSNPAVYSIEEDLQGHIWIGTFGGGINLYNQGRFIHSKNQLGYNSVMPDNVRYMKEVRPGVMMIGSKEGLFVMNSDFKQTEDIQIYRNRKRPYDPGSLSDNDVMFVYCASDKQIYLATGSGGVCRVLSDSLLSSQIKFEAITMENGLASDVSTAIIEDSQRNLWVVSERALSCLSLDHRQINVYDKAYFPEPQVFSEAVPVYIHNTLFFGTNHGYMTIDPSALVQKNYCPPLAFTDLVIKNTPSFKRLGDAKNICLNADERLITLSYAALDYTDKSRMKYAYKMEGVDEGWKETSNTSITYINLPPGDLKFHLKSTNSDGSWADNEQVMNIHVDRMFFETVWGYLLIFLGIAFVIVVIVIAYLRFYRLRHRLSVEEQMTNIKLRFFTDISHELRTPLTLVDGPISEVLEDKTLSSQSRYYLEVVQKNTRRMLNLVNQILDLRKIQNKKMVLLVEQIDVIGQMGHIMENFSELANQHHIAFSIETQETVLPVWIDRDKFDKIFFNLLSNAFKFTPDGKSITLVITQTEQNVQIAVVDEGIGIKRENISHLFQRFETIMKSNLFMPSSGIGLSLVKQFVDMHHAEITVESQLDKGSTFTVSFLKGKAHFENDPNIEFLVADLVSTEKEKEEQMTDSTDGTSDEDKATVLIVEDNAELRDFMHKILSAHYKVVEATNGEEGLHLGKEMWPDVIVTDVMMPKMDGFEMITQIKKDPDIYQIPIIVLTAKTTIDDRIKGVEMGVDDYVIKPFSASYLKARIAALIEQRKQLKNRMLEMFSEENNPLARRSLEPSMPQITPADELFIQEVMAFMENNMDNPDLTIDDFSDAVKMGRTVFYGKLKTIFGLTPIDFVQEMRIKRAVQLMQTHNFSIAEIAYRTGFNDPNYFSRCFKKHFGKSPSEYRKSEIDT